MQRGAHTATLPRHALRHVLAAGPSEASHQQFNARRSVALRTGRASERFRTPGWAPPPVIGAAPVAYPAPAPVAVSPLPIRAYPAPAAGSSTPDPRLPTSRAAIADPRSTIRDPRSASTRHPARVVVAARRLPIPGSRFPDPRSAPGSRRGGDSRCPLSRSAIGDPRSACVPGTRYPTPVPSESPRVRRS